MNAVPNNRLSDDVCVCAVLLLEEAVDAVAVVVLLLLALLLMMMMMMTAAIAGHKRSMAVLQAHQSWRCING